MKEEEAKPLVALGRSAVYSKENPIESLTGGQIQEIMDDLLFRAIEPIIYNSSVFNLQIVHILSVTARNRKRKLLALDRVEGITVLCRALRSKPEIKMKCLTEVRLERSFIYKFAVNFLEEASGYHKDYQRYMVCSNADERARLDAKLRAVETMLGSSRDRLYGVLYTCQDYLDLMYEFRNSVVERYLKFAYKQAKVFVDKKTGNFDFQDVYQNFVTAVTTAIDRYDSGKGALTSYINYWILNAQTKSNSSHGHEYGVAYSIPHLQRTKLATGEKDKSNANFSVSLQQLITDDKTELEELIAGEESVDLKLEKQQELNEIRYLAKCADIRGVGRLYLEIDEVFSRKELRKMKRTMNEQLGAV